jgi:hypothetical protein
VTPCSISGASLGKGPAYAAALAPCRASVREPSTHGLVLAEESAVPCDSFEAPERRDADHQQNA